jgi:hypothetical protein
MASVAALLLIAVAPPTATDAQEPISSTVQLQLQITGVSPEGCIVEVRPGHPGCKFTPVARRVEGYVGGETVRLDAITLAASTIGADRDCSFAITLREAGQPPRTFRRGLRLSPPDPDKPDAVQTLMVHLSTPSLAARELPGTTRR